MQSARGQAAHGLRHKTDKLDPKGLAILLRNGALPPAGKYESHETGTTLKLAPGVKPGEMTYRIGSNAPVTLRPTFRDAFETPFGSSICFVRDASGKVIGLSTGDDRVWDLRFKRVR